MDEMKWIPVKERLPEEIEHTCYCNDCLVTTVKGEVIFCGGDIYSNISLTLNARRYIKCEVEAIDVYDINNEKAYKGYSGFSDDIPEEVAVIHAYDIGDGFVNVEFERITAWMPLPEAYKED